MSTTNVQMSLELNSHLYGEELIEQLEAAFEGKLVKYYAEVINDSKTFNVYIFHKILLNSIELRVSVLAGGSSHRGIPIAKGDQYKYVFFKTELPGNMDFEEQDSLVEIVKGFRDRFQSHMLEHESWLTD